VQADEHDVLARWGDRRIRRKQAGPDHHGANATEEEHDQDRDEVLDADHLVVEGQPEKAADTGLFDSLRNRLHRPAKQARQGVVEEADSDQEGGRGKEVPQDDTGVLVVFEPEQVAQPDAGKVRGDGEQNSRDGVVWNGESPFGH